MRVETNVEHTVINNQPFIMLLLREKRDRCCTFSMLHNSIDKSVVIHTEMPEEDVYVLGDKTQLQQMLFNHCLNSVHAMTFIRPTKEPWGGTLSVKLGVSAKHINRTISDTGIGIIKESLSKLFSILYNQTKAWWNRIWSLNVQKNHYPPRRYNTGDIKRKQRKLIFC